MANYNLVVIGTGGVGSASLYHAAGLTSRTIGFDRYIPPHNRGSSHGETRIIRQAYFEHPLYTPLLLESYRLWHELERHAQKQLFFETGLLQVGPEEGVVIPGVLKSAEEHSLDVEQFSRKEIENRWPAFKVPAGLCGVFETRAGYLRVEDCVESHLTAAREAGAEVATSCKVLGWHPETPIRVQTTNGEITTEKLIIAAGAWASSLLSNLGAKLEILKKHVYWYASRERLANIPCYLFELPHGVFYGFPALEGRAKVAEHSGGEPIEDPKNYDRGIDPHDATRVMNFLNSCLPQEVDGLAEHQTCLYTMSPDEHFIVDFHPLNKNIVFAAGLSGHGFKFTPVLGKALAEMALNAGTDLPVGFLTLNRFEK